MHLVTVERNGLRYRVAFDKIGGRARSVTRLFMGKTDGLEHPRPLAMTFARPVVELARKAMRAA